MPLTIGARLGPYEVVSALGAGGMGEVYRATDTNLKRAVALKVLPESVAADSGRLARFQREAEVLASLNHPHIAVIYGLEESEGIWRESGATRPVNSTADAPSIKLRSRKVRRPKQAFRSKSRCHRLQAGRVRRIDCGLQHNARAAGDRVEQRVPQAAAP
jgi:serine/threonine protein kinase